MCRPNVSNSSVVDPTRKDNDAVRGISSNSIPVGKHKEKRDQHNGFLYGTISLALVVTASTVVMGHSQSKRDQLGCDTVCVGGMTSARSTLALVGSTIVGRSSDSTYFDKTFGISARQFFLVVGVIASAVELAIASQTDSLTGLWISLIPSALLQQNFNLLKALFGEYHDDSASPAERAGSVGKLGMAAGLAFMAGPLLSSVVFNTYNDAALFASGCLLLALWFVIQLPKPCTIIDNGSGGSNDVINDTKKHLNSDDNSERKSDDNRSPSPNSTESASKESSWWSRFVPDLVPAARTPPAIFIMTCRICMALSFHIFQTIWAVALKERFNFGPKDYGLYYSFIGFGFAMSQGFLAEAILKQFGNTTLGRTRLLLICSVTLGCGRFLAYQTDSIAVVYALFGLIIVALGLINTIFTADTSKIASPNELGGLFGVLSSVESLAGITGPMLGGLFSKSIHNERGPLYAVVLLYGIVFGLVYSRYEDIVMKGMTSLDRSKDSVDKEEKQEKVD